MCYLRLQQYKLYLGLNLLPALLLYSVNKCNVCKMYEHSLTFIVFQPDSINEPYVPPFEGSGGDDQGGPPPMVPPPPPNYDSEGTDDRTIDCLYCLLSWKWKLEVVEIMSLLCSGASGCGNPIRPMGVWSNGPTLFSFFIGIDIRHWCRGTTQLSSYGFHVNFLPIDGKSESVWVGFFLLMERVNWCGWVSSYWWEEWIGVGGFLPVNEKSELVWVAFFLLMKRVNWCEWLSSYWWKEWIGVGGFLPIDGKSELVRVGFFLLMKRVNWCGWVSSYWWEEWIGVGGFLPINEKSELMWVAFFLLMKRVNWCGWVSSYWWKEWMKLYNWNYNHSYEIVDRIR